MSGKYPSITPVPIDPDLPFARERLTTGEWFAIEAAIHHVMEKAQLRTVHPQMAVNTVGLFIVVLAPCAYGLTHHYSQNGIAWLLGLGMLAYVLLMIPASVLLIWPWWSYWSPRWEVRAMETVPRPYWVMVVGRAMNRGYIPNWATRWGRIRGRTQFWSKKLYARRLELLRSHGIPTDVDLEVQPYHTLHIRLS